MSPELLLTFAKLLNAIICLIIIALSLWHNAKEKNHSNRFIAVIIGLLILLIWQIIDSTIAETPLITLSLFLIMFLVIKSFKISKIAHKTQNSTKQTDELLAQAKEQERSRIYANLHDDVGAKLLELIYTAQDDNSKNLAKQVLGKIRQAVASTVNIQYNVSQLADEISSEAELRLNQNSIKILNSNDFSNPNQSLAAAVPAAIIRISREVVSNIIKHANASQVEISVKTTQAKLELTISDNGKGFVDKNNQGKGLKTINKRAQSISSVIEWHSQPNKGTRFSLVYNYGNH